MRINSSVQIGISNSMTQTSRAIERSLSRLSSGKRINSAKDDVAGYSVSQGLTSRIRGIQQANLNINQSLGLLQTADAAISTQSDIVQRMREISVQAANGTLSTSDRTKLNNELNTLLDEFNRITNETEFAGIKLLDGSFGTKALQIGAGQAESFDVELNDLQASAIFTKTVGTGTFKSAVTISVGDENDDNGLADMDGDGDLDLVTVEDTGTTISVFKNNGSGTFSPRVTNSAAGDPVVLRIGDVNNDGANDVVVLDASTDSLDVYINNGDGTLQARVTYSIGTTITGGTEFQIADLNGDGYNDLVVGSTSTTIQTLMNDQDGTFGTAVSTSLTSGVDGDNIDVADFNGDGKNDVLVVADDDGVGQLLINDGSGSFTLGSTLDFSDSTSLINIAIGDINNDGKMDVVSAGTGAANIIAKIGDGAGSFSSTVTSALTAAMLDLRMADFNNDGNMDLVARTSAAYYMYTGNGAGTFTTSTTAAQTSTAGLAVGDVDGDGVKDFILNASASDAVYFYEGNTRSSSALADFALANVADANLLTTVLDTTLNALTSERAGIANAMVRLEQASDYNSSQQESLTSAKSSIEDADLGEETSELTRNQIMQQAQIAALSQANANAQAVLGLLQNL